MRLSRQQLRKRESMSQSGQVKIRLEGHNENRHVGKSIARVDAPDKVTGKAIYAMDINPNRLLHAKLLTSPVAHARLIEVDIEEAEKVEGVEVIITYKDVPDTRRGQFILDQPILATEKLRYIGEPIAAVAAETPEIAEEAVNLIKLQYEELPAVFDLEEAFSENPCATVHEDVRSYQFAKQGDPRFEKRDHVDEEYTNRPNLMYTDSLEVGEVESAFEDADHVVEGRYEVKSLQHCSMEPHVSVGRRMGSTIKIWTSQQVPHNIETELCMAYPELNPGDIEIKSPYVGGGFGGKITPFIESILVGILQKTDRPVRLQLTRAEEYMVGVSRPQVIVRVKDGVTKEGKIIARDSEILFNVGAYNEQVFRCTVSGPSVTVGSYKIPNVKYTSCAVYTNLPKYAAFRGFGKPEVNWAMERHMDKIARVVGLDPIEYRLKNLLRAGDINAKGETLGKVDTEACLIKSAEGLRSIDIESKYPEYDTEEWKIGIGIAYGNKPVSRASAAATIKVQRDMNVIAYIGAPEIGQGAETVLTQIIAEGFDIELGKVKIIAGDTANSPYDRGPTGSRFTYHTGNAVRKAIADVKQKMFDLAVGEFDEKIDSSDLKTSDGEIILKGKEDNRISVNRLFSNYGQMVGVSNTMLKEGGELIGTATYDSRKGGKHHAFWTPVGQAALVAVNQITGRVEVLRMITATDVGFALNPKSVEQQIEGATGQGISSALYEEIIYEKGLVVNPNFKDYRIPGTMELPYESETIIIETEDEVGPYGARGVGEMGMMASAPAIGNAIVNALSIEFDTIPITPERVIEALENQSN